MIPSLGVFLLRGDSHFFFGCARISFLSRDCLTCLTVAYIYMEIFRDLSFAIVYITACED